MAEIRQIKTSRDDQQDTVKKLLDDALAENFTAIALIGIKENENFVVMSSGIPSQTKMVGMLEFAKFDILAKASKD